MDEFGVGHSSRLSHFGPVRNPYDASRIAGGSSGGSAVAVATGMCCVALGSDTSGSIRLPSAHCGVVGLKPGHGMVSVKGVLDLSPSLDHVGPICCTPQDAALVLQVISGNNVGLKELRRSGMRLGVPQKFFYTGLNTEVEHSVRRAIEVLQGTLKASIKDVDLPAPRWPDGDAADFHPTIRLWEAVLGHEAASFHEPLLQTSSEKYVPAVRTRVTRMLKRLSASQQELAYAGLQRVRAAAVEVFREVDVLITPTSPTLAGPIDEEPPRSQMNNTIPFSVYGLPAMSVPCGFSWAGLPIGMQLVGSRGAEALVLSIAESYHRATQIMRRSR
jgi:aspartyl-tRNA(Asn)/glutamyl-tRNA(Gln) amidotransferase subunit A